MNGCSCLLNSLHSSSFDCDSSVLGKPQGRKRGLPLHSISYPFPASPPKKAKRKTEKTSALFSNGHRRMEDLCQSRSCSGVACATRTLLTCPCCMTHISQAAQGSHKCWWPCGLVVWQDEKGGAPKFPTKNRAASHSHCGC